MRELSLSYVSALALARESRATITPNLGFECQLSVWEQCDYDIMTQEPGSDATQEKGAYYAWKSNRDSLIGRGEEAVNRTRVSSMASMAASFGKRRLQAIEKAKHKEISGKLDAVQPESLL